MELSFKQTYFEIYKNNNSIIFVKGVKIADYYHGTNLRILENYSGQGINDTITFWYCNPDQIIECNTWDLQNTYKINDTLICILRNTYLSGNIVRCDTCPDFVDTLELEKEGDYSIIDCYPSVLKFSQGKVSGWIYKPYQDTTITYDDFTNMLNGLTGVNYSEEIENQIVIFPNPTDEQINLSIPHNETLISFEITDLYGRLMDEEKVTKGNNLLYYSFAHYSKGQYLIKLILTNCIVTKKIIKE